MLPQPLQHFEPVHSWQFEVEQNELLDYLVNSSRQYGMDPNTFIEQVEKAGQLPAIVAEVARSKATAFALRRATIVDTKGKPVDLSDVIGTVEQEKKKDADGGDLAV